MITTFESLTEFIKKHGPRPGDLELLEKLKPKENLKPNLLSAPAQAEPPAEIMPTLQPEVTPLCMSEARECATSTKVKTPQPKGEPDSRGGQHQPFDKKAYQREYMRKQRARERAAKK